MVCCVFLSSMGVMMKQWLVMFVLLGLVSCSNQEMYDTVREAKQSECRSLQDTKQYNECMQRFSPSYEEYQRAREQVSQ